MIGNYLRITPLELDRTREDPAWASEFAEDLADAELDAPDSPDGKLAAERLFRTDKAWDALRFLYERAGPPADLIFGEEEFTDDDWGYGPAHLLTVDQVQAASMFLSAVTFDELTRGLTAADLAAANLYPQIWDEPNVFDWVRGYHANLTVYFAAASAAGDAMIAWLD